MIRFTGTELLKIAADIPEVSCVAIFHNDKILMGRRRDNRRWTTPGGHLEGKETSLEGAVREAREESGIDLEPHTLKHLRTEVVTKPDGNKIRVHAYRAFVHKAPTSIKEDPDAEVHRWHWLSLETLFSPSVWGELHVPPEDNVVMKGLGFIGQQKTAAFLTFNEIKLKAPKHPDSWYPKDQIAKGMVVEKEHSENPDVRCNITKNHVDEDKTYYNNALFKKDLEKGASMSRMLAGFEKQAVSFTGGGLGGVGGTLLARKLGVKSGGAAEAALIGAGAITGSRAGTVLRNKAAEANSEEYKRLKDRIESRKKPEETHEKSAEQIFWTGFDRAAER